MSAADHHLRAARVPPTCSSDLWGELFTALAEWHRRQTDPDPFDVLEVKGKWITVIGRVGSVQRCELPSGSQTVLGQAAILEYAPRRSVEIAAKLSPPLVPGSGRDQSLWPAPALAEADGQMLLVKGRLRSYRDVTGEHRTWIEVREVLPIGEDEFREWLDEMEPSP